MKFKANSLFYLMLMNEVKEQYSWYQIMTLNNVDGFVMNELKFSNGNMIEPINLQGIQILANGLSWSSNFVISNCDTDGMDCEISGYSNDLMSTFAKNANFTWKVQMNTENDWGLYPKSGRPSQQFKSC